MSILTVGSGMTYKTIASAVAASKDGDVIQVKAGSYVNDFLTINTKITIEGVGGMVHLVENTSPPNGKAMIVTNSTVTLENLEISNVSVPDLNGAAVRYQGGGDLTILNCYFHNNQEGILAGDDLTGTITIKNSEIAYNGSNGYSHNVYINNVGTTIVDNSYIHDVLGHGSEFRSRGANTTITNSRIVDVSYADNYTIDLPAGGNVLLSNNVIEKAAGATNPIMVHYGVDSVVPWHNNSSLTVTNNTFINYNGTAAWGIWNGSASTTDPVVGTASGNKFYGLQSTHLTYGAVTASGSTVLSSAPTISATHPWSTTAAPPVAQSITGGAVQLVISASGGENTITGGSGGLVVSAGQYDTITTAAAAADTITAGAYDTIRSNGNDVIAGGDNDTVTASGAFSITGGSGSNSYTLAGSGSLTTQGADTISAGNGAVTVTTTATSQDTVQGGSGPLTINAGGGGNVTFLGGSGPTSIAGGSGDLQVTAGVGNVSLTGGSGALTLQVGSGGATVTEGSGVNAIFFGAGNSTVTSGSGGTTYNFVAGSGGATDLINNYQVGTDQLAYQGFAGSAVASQTVSAGSTYISLTDGTHIVLAGVQLA